MFFSEGVFPKFIIFLNSNFFLIWSKGGVVVVGCEGGGAQLGST